MAHQVLARKYRPRTFKAMAGQEHVLQALVNGLDNDRLHHAYLFTGTRGVGKTTIARILAKCLNCEQGIGSEPCGECGTCRVIDEGRFVDLIEVDAASRTKVEDTRELLDNVQYAPSQGRYKIYLVDEVHMLSTHSFNALLKTLEEPPPHVKFLLATTDPQKVPVTVLSRCLQFNLKRLPASVIGGYLREILEQEAVPTEESALARLARSADGSMRDALSLADQALAYGGGRLDDTNVRNMLGSIDDDRVVSILEALAQRDGPAVMDEVEQLTERTPDFDDVLAALLSQLHAVSLLQTVPDAVDPDYPERERLQALSQVLPPEDVQLFYQIGLTGRRDLPLAPEPRMGFEMLVLRMLAFRPDDDVDGGSPGRSPSHAAPSGGAQAPSPDAGTAAPAATSASADRPSASEPQQTAVTEPAAMSPAEEITASPVTQPEPLPEWGALLEELGLTGMARALAMQCSWEAQEGETVTLRLDPGHASLRNPQLEQRIQQALAQRMGQSVTLRLRVAAADEGSDATPAARAEQARQQRQQAAEQAIRSDPAVTDMQQRFDAEVLPNSIQPAD